MLIPPIEDIKAIIIGHNIVTIKVDNELRETRSHSGR
jgi:hypothetical protein